MLQLVGIAALMVVGFVILITALTYDEALARERRRQRKHLKAPSPRHRAARKLAATREWWPRLQRRAGAARDLAVAQSTRTAARARESWPHLRYHARAARRRWLTLESTTGQVLVAVVASLLLAYLIVTFG